MLSTLHQGLHQRTGLISPHKQTTRKLTAVAYFLQHPSVLPYMPAIDSPRAAALAALPTHRSYLQYQLCNPLMPRSRSQLSCRLPSSIGSIALRSPSKQLTNGFLVSAACRDM